jgi:hypothetical protein
MNNDDDKYYYILKITIYRDFLNLNRLDLLHEQKKACQKFIPLPYREKGRG